MKQLIFLRHAEAEPHNVGGDHARCLTAKGVNDADTVGQYLKAQDITPDIIYCSDAVRTRQTCDGTTKHTGVKNIMFENALYESNIDAYHRVIANSPDECASVMIIGHNPVIHQCAIRYTFEDASASYSKLMCMYPPATLTVLNVSENAWRDITPHNADLAVYRALS